MPGTLPTDKVLKKWPVPLTNWCQQLFVAENFFVRPMNENTVPKDNAFEVEQNNLGFFTWAVNDNWELH